MGAFTLTARAAPIFLTENRFNRHAHEAGNIVVSSGDTIKSRLFDGDPESLWASVGSSDAVVESIASGLYAPGAQMSFDVQYVGVYGTNALHLVLDLSNDGVTWTNALTEAALATDYARASLAAAVPADRFRLLLYTTQTANQEKQVGNIVIAGHKFQAQYRPVGYRREPPRVRHKTANLYNGAIRSSYVYRSAANYKHRAFEARFLADTEAELANFDDLAFGGEPFIFMLQPGDKPRELYQGRVRPGSYDDNYAVLSTSGGQVVSAVLEETGGA